MSISVFDLFSIGIGPSSSHTVGPMRTAKAFLESYQLKFDLLSIGEVQVHLYGSLALTGKGHGTDRAIILGLFGETPENIDLAKIPDFEQQVREKKEMNLGGKSLISFDEKKHLLFHYAKTLPYHSNALTFKAFDHHQNLLMEKTYYSIGGGFIVDNDDLTKEIKNDHDKGGEEIIQGGEGIIDHHKIPYPFETAEELFKQCKTHKLTIAEVMMKNELTWRSQREIKKGLLNIWKVMQESVQNGIHSEGILPGGLEIKRRAPELYKTLKKRRFLNKREFHHVMDWVSLWAISVNEENASGGRIVTAPTNGAAGTIPAVIHYYEKYCPKKLVSKQGIVNFLLVAAAIGILYKKGASISAAEVGCQGEIGVACSMAAAGLASVLGGTLEQIGNAAEIGMEHNLGLTCDPVGGLVQIPCIERNVMGAMKAINSCRLAINGNGEHFISLDKVIRTMFQTGKDMQSIYKETSQGGLAVNLPEC